MEQYYSPKKVAEFLNVSKWTVLRWIKEGKLKAKKMNTRVILIAESEVDKCMMNIEDVRTARIVNHIERCNGTQKL